jgi:hypothetical protein
VHRRWSGHRGRAGGAVATGGEAAAPPSAASAASAETIAADERIAKNDRGLRRWLVLIGAPVVLAGILPWPMTAWELADRIDSAAPLVLPAIGVLAILFGAIGRIPARARAVLAGVLAIGLAWALLDLVRLSFIVREIDRLLRSVELAGFVVGLASILGAALGELFVQLRRASRPRAFVALVAWLHLLARAFVPLERDNDVDSMPFIIMMESFDRADYAEEALIPGIGLLGVGIVTLLGIATSTWRALSPMPFRPHVRFRSPWLAFALAGSPAIVTLLVFGYSAIESEMIVLAAGFIVASYLWALHLGLPLFAAHFVSACADGAGALVRDLRTGDRAAKRRALGVGALILALLVALGAWRVARAFLPDSRDATTGEFLESTSDAIVASVMGHEIDPRFLGGYSEFDLRGSRGALAESVGEGAEVEVLLTAVTVFSAAPDRGYIVVAALRSADGEVSWTGAWGGDPPELSTHISGDIGEILSRVADAAMGGACLPLPTAETFAALPPDARAMLSSTDAAARICGEGAGRDESGSWVDGLLYPAGGHGGLGPVIVWVRAGGRVHEIRSSFHGRPDRPWLERASVTTL